MILVRRYFSILQPDDVIIVEDEDEDLEDLSDLSDEEYEQKRKEEIEATRKGNKS